MITQKPRLSSHKPCSFHSPETLPHGAGRLDLEDGVGVPPSHVSPQAVAFPRARVQRGMALHSLLQAGPVTTGLSAGPAGQRGGHTRWLWERPGRCPDACPPVV